MCCDLLGWKSAACGLRCWIWKIATRPESHDSNPEPSSQKRVAAFDSNSANSGSFKCFVMIFSSKMYAFLISNRSRSSVCWWMLVIWTIYLIVRGVYCAFHIHICHIFIYVTWTLWFSMWEYLWFNLSKSYFEVFCAADIFTENLFIFPALPLATQTGLWVFFSKKSNSEK